jgi:ankyrin repeat protein
MRNIWHGLRLNVFGLAALVAVSAWPSGAPASLLDTLSPNSELIIAIENGDREAFRLSLLQETRATVRDSTGVPAIILAVETKDVFFVDELLKAGARPNDKPRRGDDRTALTRAVEIGNAAMVRVLLEAGADPDLPGTQNEPAIIKAANLGHVAVMRALLDAKVNMEATDMTGRTALESARRSGQNRIVAMLEAAGATY